MEVAEIALDIDQVLEKGAFVAPLYYRFSWNKVVCLVPEKELLPDLKKYRAKGARTVYVTSEKLKEIHDLELSYCGVRYGPEMLIPPEKRRYLFQLLEEASQRLHKVGVRVPRLAHVKSEMRALIYLLSTNSLLAGAITELLDESPQLMRHSMEVALLAQLLYETTMEESPLDHDSTLLLLGLIHDLGKVNLPSDLRDKNRSQLTKTEELIFASYTQNLSLTIERDPASSQDIKNLVNDYDRLEREETFLTYEERAQAWLVIIANRLAEYVLPESQFSSMGRFKEALLKVEAEGLGLPLEVVKSFKAHVVEGRWGLAA